MFQLISLYVDVCRAHVIHHDGAIWHVLFDGQVCKDRLESVRFSPGINNPNVQLKIETWNKTSTFDLK